MSSKTKIVGRRLDMSREMSESKALRVLVVLSQILLGMLFIFSGLMKGIDPMGTAIKIEEYTANFGLSIGMPLATGLAVSLNVFEALLGVLLLFGVKPGLSSLLTLVLMVPMTLLTLYIYIFNPVSDCGCFGDALKISNGATFAKNVVILALTLLLYRRPYMMWSALGRRADLPVAITTGLLLLYFNIYPLVFLPVVDFRPYKVGADLHELTTGGAEEGEYDYRFVYAKGGEERVFTMDELSTIDDTWSYVRDETVELKPPVEAPGADFVVIDSDGMPQTKLLARPEKNALLFVVSDLNAVTTSDMEMGAELQERTGMPVTLVSGNSFDEVHGKKHARKSAPFSNFYFLDRTTAKTVIRANPGLLVIGEGKIARKSSMAQLRRLMKDEDFVRDPYRMMTKQESRKGLRYTFGVMASWLVVLIALSIRRYRRRVSATGQAIE